MQRRALIIACTLAGFVLLVTRHEPAERAAVPMAAARAAQRPAGAPPRKGPGGLPITGKTAAVLAPLDEAVEKIMLRHGIPGLAMAITRDGKLIAARGFGWSNYEAGELVTPQTLFGLASVSKCLTALAIMKLVEEGKLRLDQKAFAILDHLKLPRGSTADPRLQQITIRQLLNHSGGWDRDRSGDPINWSFQISQRLGVPMPITEDHLIQFMLGSRLDFAPGSKAVYSNFGFIVLGQIITRVSGTPYEKYIQTKICAPMGIKAARMHDREGRYFKGEARRYNAGLLSSMPAYNLPWTDASGGWAASAADLARLMTALDGSRGGKAFLTEESRKEMFAPPPAPLAARKDGTHFGLGWDAVQKGPKGELGYGKGGCWPGVRASVKHRFDGINTIVLYNALIQLDPLDMRIANDALREVHEAVAAVKEWPKVDLFDEYQ